MTVDEVPIMRTSERRSLLGCEWAWWHAWVEGLESRGSTPQPLWMGTGVHLALALWYCGPGLKRGPHPAETWDNYAKQEIQTVRIPGLTDDDDSTHVDAHELGIKMLEGYVERYGKDEHMHILQPEQKFDINVPWPKGRSAAFDHIKREILTRYCGTYDLAYRNLINDWILLEEHKTAATISTSHLPIDPQAGSYWAIATRSLQKMGLIGPKESLRGIEYNFLRKGLPDVRPTDAQGFATNKPIKKHYISAFEGHGIEHKKTLTLEKLDAIAKENNLVILGDRSKTQPAPLYLREMVHRTSKERATQLRRIQNDALRAEALRSGILPLTKNPGTLCSRTCQFYDLCELDERGGDTEEFKRKAFKKRDMYADHRKSADE